MLKLVVFVLFFTIASEVSGQWTRGTGAGGSVTCFFDSGSSLYAGTNNGLLLSTDHGLTWQSLIDYGFHAGAPKIYAVTTLGSDIFAAVGAYEWGSPGHGIIRSTDDGFNWTPVNGGLHRDSSIWYMASLGSYLFATTYDGIYRSTDSGKKWFVVDTFSPAHFTSIVVWGDTLLAGIYGGMIMSTDSGSSWVALSGATPPYVGSIATDGPTIAVTSGYNMFLSTDRGVNWSVMDDTLAGDIHISDYASYYDEFSLFFSGHNLFACMSSSQGVPGVVVSTDLGKHWMVLDSGRLSDPDRVNALVVSGPNLVLGSTFGLWYRPLSDFTEGVVLAATNPSIQLSPNPTGGIISIRADNIANITIENILGSRVLEVATPRSPEFTLDLTKLPAGIYFARFEMESGEVVMRKIVKE